MGEAEAGHLVRREEGRALRLLLVLRRRGAVRGGHGLELGRGNGEGRTGGKLIESRGWREANYRRKGGNRGGRVRFESKSPVGSFATMEEGR